MNELKYGSKDLEEVSFLIFLEKPKKDRDRATLIENSLSEKCRHSSAFVTQPSTHTCFHAHVQRGQSTTTTHTLGYSAATHTQKRLENMDLHCDAILYRCDARSPAFGEEEDRES